MDFECLQELCHNITLTDCFINNKLSHPANLDKIRRRAVQEKVVGHLLLFSP
jgi:hypothetical protein